MRKTRSAGDARGKRNQKKKKEQEQKAKERKSENIQGQCHGNAKCGVRRWRDELDDVIVIFKLDVLRRWAGWVW